ncbi:hypothetical protein AGMMS50255_7670 [Spirochaetia bacterium]|nr:hypothetical protein AGMMS50255_7670 [Spirochaetia bacterium]
MKNGKMILGGMAVLLLAFGLVFTACDTGGGSGGSGGDNSTKFEGTWTNTGSDGGINILTFNKNNVTCTRNGNLRWSGTFTYTDTELNCTDTNGKKLIVDYTLTGNTLTLGVNKETSNNVGSHATGTYTKHDGGNTDPKTITVNGISGLTGDVNIRIFGDLNYRSGTQPVNVAAAVGTIAGGSVIPN